MKKLTWILASIVVTMLLFSACTAAPTVSEDSQSAEATAPTVTVSEDAQSAEATDSAVATDEPQAAEPSDGVSFSLTTLTGDTIDQTIFSDHKLTMVNYWATWCGPCVSEIPDLVKISADYADKGFALIGVHVDDTDLDGVKEFIANQNIAYPVVLPEGFFLEMIQGYQYIPTTLFFDSQGNQVGEAIVGSMGYSDWAAEIEARLAQVS